MWAVHGGGFYHPVKFAVSPPQLPAHLHWFYWESYTTWLSGFALFAVSYLWNAGSYLVDKSLVDWSPGRSPARWRWPSWSCSGSPTTLICRVFGSRPGGDRDRRRAGGGAGRAGVLAGLPAGSRAAPPSCWWAP